MIFLSIALSAAVLLAAAWSATRTGPRLILALALLTFGVISINPLIEAVAFDVMPLADVPAIMLWQGVLSLLLSALAVLALGKFRPDPKSPFRPRFTLPRLAAVAVLYTCLYLAAGMLVYPFIRDFYAGKSLPSMPVVIGLQLLRGPLYALYAWPWLRLANRHTSLILALVYAVPGGVCMLLVDDNPYMPRQVRYPHMVEVGISNFLFGWLTARLLQFPPSTKD